MRHEHSVLSALREVEADYSPEHDRPLGALLAVLTSYGALAATTVAAATEKRRDVSWGDIVRVGVATP